MEPTRTCGEFRHVLSLYFLWCFESSPQPHFGDTCSCWLEVKWNTTPTTVQFLFGWNRRILISSSIIRTTFWEGYLSHQHLINSGKILNSPGCHNCCNAPSNCEADVTLGASFTVPRLPGWTPGTGGKLSVSRFQSWKGSGTKDAPQRLYQSTENNHSFWAPIVIFCGWLFALIVVDSSNDSNIDFKMSKGRTRVSQHVP